ncbi:deoxyribose-phosphate aldolase [Anaerofustis stercorihominis]|uniref:Deoxyribose-phosphate aldolase n=1 Tax=Anaerofustis stercorihominis DSM 17244 TaxID=445971 RepID=B1C5N8_9FIRM|nr:deoxyribose-phosphate aldolase [Anaerofustis stercorihominis]EDS73602.1 deoxyribose-phosphate aldolase [Anaerofustis stercorihominis DSM 17244]MCQ4794734.1 deoxyribose-phosphate aldolase [Anaerofustis stercorihominis]
MKKEVDLKNISRMIDVSTVRTDIVMDEVEEMIDTVIKYNCICASPMPWVTKYTIDRLKDYPDIVTTGVVSFPSGAATTANKIIEAKENIAMGCEELDMVSNVSALKSGKYDYFVDDIKAVVEAADGVPVKSIIEICYLTDDEIKKASELCVKAGVTYVKTGTGWGPKPTTVETIKLIKETIGDDALIKAAGGVRDLDTLIAMAEIGCNRFGLGVRSAGTILEEAKKRVNG